MRRITVSALIIGLALVPATVGAQQPGPRRGAGHPGMAGNPAARVLELPTVLGLTAAQVSQLEQIREKTQAQNQPLLEQLQALRPERAVGGRGGPGALTPEQRAERRAQMQERRAEMQERRAEMRAKREQLQPIMEQVRGNAANARREVEAVLTSAQLAKLRELEGARRAGGMRGPRPGPRPIR